MAEHLDHRVEVPASVRDRIRDELGHYAYDTIMLDGVPRITHDRVVINTNYWEDAKASTTENNVTDETHPTLFTKESETAA